MQIGIHLGASYQDVCQGHLTDDLAQGGLGGPGDRGAVVLDFEGGFFGIPHEPEEHGIDVNGDRIFCERLLGREGRDHDTVVDPVGNRIYDGDDPEHARTCQCAEFPEPQDDGFFPLRGNLQRQQQVSANQQQHNEIDQTDSLGYPLAIEQDHSKDRDQVDDRCEKGGDTIHTNGGHYGAVRSSLFLIHRCLTFGLNWMGS